MTSTKINKYFTKSPEKHPVKRKANKDNPHIQTSGQKSRLNGSTPPTKTPNESTNESSPNQDVNINPDVHVADTSTDPNKEISQSGSDPAPSPEPPSKDTSKVDPEIPETCSNEKASPPTSEPQRSHPDQPSMDSSPSPEASLPPDAPHSEDPNITKKRNWKYVERRLLVSFRIELPNNPQHRLELLATEINAFLDTARKRSKNHLRMMRYKSTEVAHDKDKKQWIRVIKACPSYFDEFTHGYYPYQKLREGVYRLKIKVAIPLKDSKTMDQFIEACSQSWGDPEFPTVKDLPSQHIFNHKKLGWFLRSTTFMGHTRDLQKELDLLAKAQFQDLAFGLSFQTIPNPNNGPSLRHRVYVIVIFCP